jgi:hypothetical protein
MCIYFKSKRFSWTPSPLCGDTTARKRNNPIAKITTEKQLKWWHAGIPAINLHLFLDCDPKRPRILQFWWTFWVLRVWEDFVLFVFVFCNFSNGGKMKLTCLIQEDRTLSREWIDNWIFAFYLMMFSPIIVINNNWLWH